MWQAGRSIVRAATMAGLYFGMSAVVPSQFGKGAVQFGMFEFWSATLAPPPTWPRAAAAAAAAAVAAASMCARARARGAAPRRPRARAAAGSGGRQRGGPRAFAAGAPRRVRGRAADDAARRLRSAAGRARRGAARYGRRSEPPTALGGVGDEAQAPVSRSLPRLPRRYGRVRRASRVRAPRGRPGSGAAARRSPATGARLGTRFLRMRQAPRDAPGMTGPPPSLALKVRRGAPRARRAPRRHARRERRRRRLRRAGWHAGAAGATCGALSAPVNNPADVTGPRLRRERARAPREPHARAAAAARPAPASGRPCPSRPLDAIGSRPRRFRARPTPRRRASTTRASRAWAR